MLLAALQPLLLHYTSQQRTFFHWLLAYIKQFDVLIIYFLTFCKPFPRKLFILLSNVTLIYIRQYYYLCLIYALVVYVQRTLICVLLQIVNTSVRGKFVLFELKYRIR